MKCHSLYCAPAKSKMSRTPRFNRLAIWYSKDSHPRVNTFCEVTNINGVACTCLNQGFLQVGLHMHLGRKQVEIIGKGDDDLGAEQALPPSKIYNYPLFCDQWSLASNSRIIHQHTALSWRLTDHRRQSVMAGRQVGRPQVDRGLCKPIPQEQTCFLWLDNCLHLQLRLGHKV